MIGHSSGAIAIMRLLEMQRLAGAVLVCPYHTDLGEENEKASHYFDEPWDWKSIKNNAEILIQFSSTNDEFIPI